MYLKIIQNQIRWNTILTSVVALQCPRFQEIHCCSMDILIQSILYRVKVQ